MRMLSAILFTVAGLYLACALYLYAIQARVIYYPTRAVAATPKQIGLAYEDVTLTTEDGERLHGWFVPAEDARGVVLFLHGNAGNIGDRLETLSILHGLRFSTLIVDYRGYGRSSGTPSEQGTYRDAEACWRHLVEERGIPSGKIVIFGRSLGGAVAAWLGARHEAGALVVESAFTAIPDMAAELYPLLPARWLARIRYPTIKFIRHARSPVLVVHSPEDDLVPYHHGRRLYEAAPEPKSFLEIRGGHNEGFLSTGRAYVEGLDEFLNRHHLAP